MTDHKDDQTPQVAELIAAAIDGIDQVARSRAWLEAKKLSRRTGVQVASAVVGIALAIAGLRARGLSDLDRAGLLV
jgi:hypothetical protein